MLKAGDRAPEFVAESTQGTVSLSNFRGKKVVLYFYSKDMTSGCAKEAALFRDEFTAFVESNTVIIGVSKDTYASHIKFAEKYSIPFILLSDPELEIIQDYGVWKEKNMYGKKTMGVERTTFLIDERGIILKIYPKVKVDGHVQKILNDLHAIIENSRKE